MLKNIDGIEAPHRGPATAAWPLETLWSFGESKLRTLCRAAGFAQDEEGVVGVFRRLTQPWSSATLATPPEWESDVADDHSPYEFSVAYEGARPELRMMVEPQGAPATLASNWAQGLALMTRLEQHYGVSRQRFDRVRDLFQPACGDARFSIWFAACCRLGEKPEFKLYLNPQCQGPKHAGTIIRQVLGRLGFRKAWTFLQRVQKASPHNRLCYFSLDLSDQSASRIKVYIAHAHATADEVDAAMRLAGRVYEPGLAQRLSRLYVGHEGPFKQRPLLSCYAFNSDYDAEPLSATLHFPIRSYVADDAMALEAIQRVLPSRTAELHRSIVEEYAGRSLAAGPGLQSYISVRPQNGELCSTVCLSAEAYRVLPRQAAALS